MVHGLLLQSHRCGRGSGFQARQRRRHLPDRSGPPLARLLKRLRPHGRIKTVGKRSKSCLTTLGPPVATAALKLRAWVVLREPALAAAAGDMPPALHVCTIQAGRFEHHLPVPALAVTCPDCSCATLRQFDHFCYPIVMQPKTRQVLAVYKGQAMGLCWLVQQSLGSGGEVLAGLTRTLAFSRPLSGTEWSAMLPADREREVRAFHTRVRRLFSKGLAIRCPVVAKVSPTARGVKVERVRAARAQDQGLLHLLEAQGDRLRPCRHCGAWFWRERKREYCEPCFQSGTARSKVHRAKAKAVRAGESLA